MKPDWPTIEVSVAPGGVEIVSSMLWEWDTLGLETLVETAEETVLRAYFSAGVNLDDLTARLRTGLTDAGESPALLRAARGYDTPDEDWLRVWKQGYSLMPVGTRWLVVPSWKRDEAAADPALAGRLWIEIDPGMAFGTGTHETTQLCLKFLETLETEPVTTVLDVGTGTGILAIAAAKLFPAATILACDNDPEAVVVAHENLAANGVTDRIALETATVEAYAPGSCDVTLANLTADVILPIAEELVKTLRPGGHLILSGILDFQADEVAQTVERLTGIAPERAAAGEWRALCLSLDS